jgi:hypothetical protein
MDVDRQDLVIVAERFLRRAGLPGPDERRRRPRRARSGIVRGLPTV